MTYGPSGRGAWRVVLGLLASALLAACAEGAKIGDAFQGGDGDGDGGAHGDGGRRNDGGSRGDGGESHGGNGGDPNAGPTTSNVVGSSASSTDASSSVASTSVASSSAQSSAASTASSSAAQSTAAATTSASSGGGPLECNAPLDPAQDCGAGQHCFPSDLGTQPICSDAGNTGQYGACTDANQCAPIFGCVEVVVGELPCCLQFCTNDFDCPSLDDLCYFFNPPQYAGGVQYGVCYDGAPIGCG